MRRFQFAALLIFCLSAAALHPRSSLAQQNTLGPACTAADLPQFQGQGLGLKIDITSGDDVPDWAPPKCTGWEKQPFHSLISVSARFRHTGNADAIAEHLARFEGLTTIKYWSVSKQEWRPLFVDATGLAGPDVDAPRRTFSAADIQPGRILNFMQNENNPLGPVAFQIIVRDRSEIRLTFNSINISPFPVLFFDVVEPGGFQSTYLIEREAGDVWRYSALVRARIKHAFMAPSASSSKNRAQAYYRYLAGIPTDREPPAAKE